MDSTYQRHFDIRKITSTTPFSSVPNPAVSSSPMQTGPRIQWNSQSHGARGMAGVQDRNTISKDRIQGEEQRMADLLAQHGNKVMRTQYTALGVVREKYQNDIKRNDEIHQAKDKLEDLKKRLEDTINAGNHQRAADLKYGAIPLQEALIKKLEDEKNAAERTNIRAAAKQINDLTDEFNSRWLPRCRRYIESPPRDYNKRNGDHRMLSESVMQQILLKLDGVETEGDDELRRRRRDLVRQVQTLLQRLDNAKES